MPVTMVVTETRPNTSTAYAMDEPGAWGDEYRTEVNSYITWFQANRSEDITVADPTELTRTYTTVFADVETFDQYLAEWTATGLTPIVEGKSFPETTFTTDVTVS